MKLWCRSGAIITAALALAIGASTARAHNDPPGCSATGVSIEIRVFRANGTTGVVGSVSQCENIQYQAVLAKSSSAACAFQHGTFKLTLPNGTVQTISTDVPCIGGTTAPCDPAVQDLTSTKFPYQVAVADIDLVTGLITASASYQNGVAHDNEPDTINPPVSATSPKSTPVVLCTDNNACTNDLCDSNVAGAGACSHTDIPCTDNNACTQDTCNPATGVCSSGPPKTCTDNNACTTDTCNTTTGNCEFGPPKTCTDNNACTADSCNTTTGNCESGPPKTCTDNNACTADSCNTTTGNCESGPPKTCTDNNACTADSCNTTTGNCESGPPKTCTDNNACTADSCNTTTGNCESGPPPDCNDNNPCTDDSCNTTTGNCDHVANDNPECAAICRTPGYWGTHPSVTAQVITAAGGCLNVCGENITNVSSNSADSAIEAICVSPQGESRLQLARQLTSMALNCVISDFTENCSGNSGLSDLFSQCNAACQGLSSPLTVGDCVSAVDCFNNGGVINTDGLCVSDPGGSCHERALPNTLTLGPADPTTCKSARQSTACTVILTGENSCASGTKSSSAETCP